jgi:hypothetical protein
MAVGLLLVETFGRANLHTDAAIDAGKGVTSPGGGFFVYADALGRALDGTDAAKGAFFDFIDQLPPNVSKGRPDLIWV